MARYYLFILAEHTLSRLPRRIGYLIATLVGDIIYLVSPRIRGSIASNIRRVLGLEADDAAIRRLVRGVLRNASKNYLDLIRIPRMKPEQIKSQVTPHGVQHLVDALAKGRGVMLVTAHFGSFDVAVQLLAVHSVRTTIPVEALEPERLLDHVVSLRRNKGLNIIPAKSGALQAMIKALRNGEIVLIACDRDVTGEAPKALFFGEETRLPDMAVRIALRTGAAIIPVFNIRRDDGRYDVYVEPPIEVASNGNSAVAKHMNEVIRVMEKYIKSCPEQWAVLEPVWPESTSGQQV
jgi:phosphatidylinositol dimannoside acyltransferase